MSDNYQTVGDAARVEMRALRLVLAHLRAYEDIDAAMLATRAVLNWLNAVELESVTGALVGLVISTMTGSYGVDEATRKIENDIQALLDHLDNEHG
jgi:hypothetical protein